MLWFLIIVGIDGDGRLVFKVKELSRRIEEKLLLSDSGSQETLWNKLVPKKVNIFVWRALRGRLPVRVFVGTNCKMLLRS